MNQKPPLKQEAMFIETELFVMASRAIVAIADSQVIPEGRKANLLGALSSLSTERQKTAVAAREKGEGNECI